MNITIARARASDMEIVLNLIPYYVYDMGRVVGWDCNSKGIFNGCDNAREYWQTHHPDTNPNVWWPEERKGHPFVIRSQTGMAGFALIQEMGDDNTVDFDVGEFFIAGKYQRQGIGKYVAHQIFDRFPGRWTVRQIMNNIPAQKFWRNTIDAYTNGQYKENVISFEENGYSEQMICQHFDNSK